MRIRVTGYIHTDDFDAADRARLFDPTNRSGMTVQGFDWFMGMGGTGNAVYPIGDLDNVEFEIV